MILFVSDIHLGRLEPAQNREVERTLLRFLRAHEGQISRLILLGDVFDEYIEYRRLIPKGFPRFQALLADWTESGIRVTYLVGNHDPWHLDYFRQELGVEVVEGPLLEPLPGARVYMNHGDGIDPASRVYTRLKPWLRHPAPVWLYRTLLPGDAGMAAAHWVNRRFGENEVKESTVEALRRFARSTLASGAADCVVMGHSHRPERILYPEGLYVNTGCWYESQTFGRLDENGLTLRRWDGSASAALDETFTPIPEDAG